MIQSPYDLHNKVIVVTGASSGIGRACALACSNLGAILILVGRNISELEKTQHMMHERASARILAVDLTHFEEVSKAFSRMLRETGPVCGVIHAAGISTTLPFRNVNPEKLQYFFTVNVAAALHLTQVLLKPKHFNAVGGSVVYLTSVMSQVGESAKLLYSMSKGALLSASRSLAIELAPRKIRINCVAPGVVDTPMSQQAYYSQNPELKVRIESLHPLGFGTAEDVAGACTFLLSDAARWITGSQLTIDGGYTAK
jgi:NAD(P)-dependent dehydrogenase (short-subunit alcohol dehydrogenase family)